jgi:hypothetical protein
MLAKEPVDVDELPVLRGAAVQIREVLAQQLLICPGLVVAFCGQAVSRGIKSGVDIAMIVLLLGMRLLLGFVAPPVPTNRCVPQLKWTRLIR